MTYKNLFTPFQIGGVNLKNRLVMSPVTMNYATEGGLATPKLIRHYLERARGGVGLIIIEGTFFEPAGRGYRNQLGLLSDEHVRSLLPLTRALRELKNDVKCFMQIHHAGWRAASKITGLQPVAPSAIQPYPGAAVPHELTIGEIKLLIQAHVKAAVRAKEAGFDGVDIHCAHGYLIPSFFSPLSNRRNDEYGGDLAGRSRFLVETIKAMKAELGHDFPVTIKISGHEFMEGGLDQTEMIRIALIAQGAGIDGVTISAGGVGGAKVGDLTRMHQLLRTLPMMTDPACLAPLAAQFKQSLKIPVIAVGRINTPALAEELIAKGWCDLTAMARPLLADPYLPQKAKDGHEDTIRPCIACNEGCYKRIFEQAEIQCAVNPVLGREQDDSQPAIDSAKNVVVVGGGPAGLEAAYRAWKKGHKVTLFEEQERLGGQLNIASVPPGRKEIELFSDYQHRRLAATGAVLKLGRKATVDEIKSVAPDAVILASGARPSNPPVCQLGWINCQTAWEILEDKVDPPSPILILGAGLVGCETADYLLQKGKKVHLVDVLPEIAQDSDGDTQSYFALRFNDERVTVHTGTTVEKVDGPVVVVKKNEAQTTIDYQTVVFAVGAEPMDELSGELADAGIPVYKIGDCVQPRNILRAVHDGYQVCLDL